MEEFRHRMDEFGSWLEREVAARGWTMGDLARRAGVSDAAISRILKGLRHPSPELCRALAEALDVPAEPVFRLTGLLSPLPATGDDAPIAQVADLWRHLSAEERQEIADYVEWRYHRRGP